MAKMTVMKAVKMEMIINSLYLKWIQMKMMKIFKHKKILIIVFNFNKKFKKQEQSKNEQYNIYI